MEKVGSSEQQLIEDLCAGGKAADLALAEVYQNNRGLIVQFVQCNGGTEAEAKDVFQEAVIRFFENIQAARFKGESTVATYLYSIARFVWLNRLKRQKIERRIKDTYASASIAPSFMEQFFEQEKEEQVFAVFDELGAQCKELLIASIYYQYSMDEISQRLHYSSNQIARNQKYRCLKKLKELLRAKPHLLHFLRKEQ